MLEEIKQILSLVKELPHMVMWVLAGLLFYKVSIIGSIYGLIRFGIEKLHSYLTHEKIITHQWSIDGVIINKECHSLLVGFISSLGTKTIAKYVYSSDIAEMIRLYNVGKDYELKLKQEQDKQNGR